MSPAEPPSFSKVPIGEIHTTEGADIEIARNSNRTMRQPTPTQNQTDNPDQYKEK